MIAEEKYDRWIKEIKIITKEYLNGIEKKKKNQM